MVVTICVEWTGRHRILRGIVASTVPRDGTESQTWFDPQLLLLPHLHIPSILTSVAFKTSLSFSFVMLPVTVT